MVNYSAALSVKVTSLPVFLLSLICFPVWADTPLVKGDPDRGAELYQEYSCYACHGFTGETGSGTRLNPPRFDLAGFIAYVRNPSGRRVEYGPGGKMPAYRSENVTAQNLTDIYAYLKAMPSNTLELSEIPLLTEILGDDKGNL